MSFLYWLPGPKEKPAAQQIAEAGLAHAFERPPSHWGVERGPDGKTGVVLCAGEAPAKYRPDRQEWRRMVANQAGAWLGLPTDHTPGPNDLARDEILPGQPVQMADGQKWTAPIARAAVPDAESPLVWYNALPRRSTRDDSGQWVPGEVLSQYAALWDLACRWHDAYFAAIDGTDANQRHLAFDFEGVHEGAVEALQANYRIGPDEADWLGLLTQETAVAVLHVLIDLPARLKMAAELEKKSGPEAPAT